MKRNLLRFFLLLLISKPLFSQFIATPPVQDGVINASEYGNHTPGVNNGGDGDRWYMTWDDTNLYVGIINANRTEASVVYIAANPSTPINGGTDADGTNVGHPYDGTNFAELQFRADIVLYVKNDYREYRTANGTNGWSAATTFFGSYGDNGSNIREFTIAWSAIGGRPESFAWFGYLTSSGGSVYGEVPSQIADGPIGIAARWGFYQTVNNTNDGTSIPPFSRQSYVFTLTTDISSFNAVSVYDFTMNTAGRSITRGTGSWTIAGDFFINQGTISFGSTSSSCTVSGNTVVNSGGTLTLSSAIGGDLTLAGNLTVNGGSFNTNNRAVFFNGAASQTITAVPSVSLSFVFINKPSGNVILAPSTNLNVTGSGGISFDVSNIGGLDLNGNTITFTGSSGSIRASGVSGVRNIVGVVGSAIVISGTRSLTSTGGNSWNLGSNVALTVEETGFLEVSATVAFGQNPTVNGTFRLLGAPIISGITAVNYGPNSTLSFSSITGYTVGASDIFWPASGGPHNVEIGAGTTAFVVNDNRSVDGTLFFLNPFTISTGVGVRINGLLNSQTLTSPTINGSLVYGPRASLQFSASGNYVDAEVKPIWPVSGSRPFNVIALGNSSIYLEVDGQTVDGVIRTSREIRILSSLTVNDTLQITTNGFIGLNPPTYGPNATLHYNTGGTYGRGIEWLSTTASNTPHHVRLSNATTLNLGANLGTGTPRKCTGDLTIDAGSLFQMAGTNAMTATLSVEGSLNLSGELRLSTLIGGDFRLQGELRTNPGGVLTTNNRAVFLEGGFTQRLNGDGDLTLSYLIINKTAGSVVLNSPLTINAGVGNVLDMADGTDIELNEHNFTLATDGGNVLIPTDGTATIRSSNGIGQLVIAGNKNYTGVNTELIIAANLQLNFGKTFTLNNNTITFERGIVSNGALVGNADAVIKITNQNGYDAPFGTLRLETVTEIKNLEITRPSHTILLGQNIAVNGQLTLNSGIFDLNGNNINFGTTGSYFQPFLTVGALINSRVNILAYLQGEANINAVGGTEIAGIGLIITTPDDLGLTTVRWYPSSRKVGSGSIRRFYSIQPTNSGSLTATMQLLVVNSSTFDETEGNDPNLLEFYSSNDINFTTSTNHPFTTPNPFFRETDDDISLTGGSPTFFTLAPPPYLDFTVQNGEWGSPTTWNNGQVPPNNAALTINHVVTESGFSVSRYVSDLTINPGGELEFGDNELIIKNGYTLATTITAPDAAVIFANVQFPGSVTVSNRFLMSNVKLFGEANLTSGKLTIRDTFSFQQGASVSHSEIHFLNRATLRYEGFGGTTKNAGLEWATSNQTLTVPSTTPRGVQLHQTGGLGNFTLNLSSDSRAVDGSILIGSNTELSLAAHPTNPLIMTDPSFDGVMNRFTNNGTFTPNGRWLLIRNEAKIDGTTETAFSRIHLVGESSLNLEQNISLTEPHTGSLYLSDSLNSNPNQVNLGGFRIRLGNDCGILFTSGTTLESNFISLHPSTFEPVIGQIEFLNAGALRTQFRVSLPEPKLVFGAFTQVLINNSLTIGSGDSVLFGGALRILPGGFVSVSGDSVTFFGNNSSLSYETSGGPYGIGREWRRNPATGPKIVSVGSSGLTNLNSNRSVRRLNLLGNVTSSAGVPTLFADSIYANEAQFLRTGTSFTIQVNNSGFFQSSRTDGLNGHAGSGVTLNFGTLTDFLFNPSANANFNAGTLFPSLVRNLTINHQGSAGFNTINLNQLIQLRDTLRLENGVLETNDNLQIGTDFSSFIQTNGRISGAIAGYFRRIIQTGASVSFDQSLPVGGAVDEILHYGSGMLELSDAINPNLETNRLHLRGPLTFDGAISALSLKNSSPTSLTRTGNGRIIANPSFPTNFKFSRDFDGIPGTYLYPMGAAAFYKGVELEYTAFSASPGATVEVTYVDSPPGYGGLGFFDNGVQIENVAPHYWIITHNLSSMDNGTLRIYNQGVEGVGNVPLLRLVESSDGGATWGAIAGGSGSYDNSLTFTFFPPIYEVALTGLSISGSGKGFTYGGNWADNPLPVELAEFTATSKENGIHLAWRTASEINSHGFTISRKRASETDWKQMASYRNSSGLKAKNSAAGSSYQFVDESDMSIGEVFEYRLEETGFDGKHEILKTVSVESRFDNQIREFALSQNYPNPFNPTTTIRYDLKERAEVTLEVYNLLGQRVSILTGGTQARGRYQVKFNANALSSGVYFYRLSAKGQNETFTQVKKMMLLK